ncbi:M56 family metallopeptidase [Aequorivita capsosiphonis]|uniref:M56 family metallopeptidase n=1 Tax=Aequorivita capsosiphonis TaxID=487317 RepID=UPI00041CAB9B|nr:M56 family metallopeptidase [Aequorivita capsosiphonis]
MIHTILQILTFQVLFLAVYDLFLKKETFFNLNRIYLLLTPVLGFILPFISFDFIQQYIPQEYIIQLPGVIIGGEVSETVSNGTSLWITGLLWLWLFGMGISALFFCWKLYKITKLKSAGIIKNLPDYKLILLPKTDTAFSFYKTIYLGENISEENKTSIIAHEKIHIQQKHTIDLLFFEALRILFWFNPMIYLFQNRMTTLHEFIADAEVTAQNDKKQYYQSLLSEVFQTEKISFINTFFNQSLIKKRIIMLQKSKSHRSNLAKYLLIVPLLGAMLIYTSCSDSMDRMQEEQTLMDPPPPPPPPIPPPPPPPTLATGEDMDVPYSAIEQVPTYPGCSGDNETMKKCMSTKIAESINSNFNTGVADDLKLSGRQRISVQFKIDKTGNVVDVTARSLSNTAELEAEAIRVVKLLPHMEPGEQKGEKVSVLYSLPIVFDIVE